jgi:hypothetical protein
LSGTVNSQSKRAEVEKMATKVPNVQQVVNELQAKNQKATSSSSLLKNPSDPPTVSLI